MFDHREHKAHEAYFHTPNQLHNCYNRHASRIMQSANSIISILLVKIAFEGRIIRAIATSALCSKQAAKYSLILKP